MKPSETAFECRVFGFVKCHWALCVILDWALCTGTARSKCLK